MIIYSIMCKSSSFILYTKSQNTISAFQGFIWAFTQVLCVQVQVQEAASEPKTPALQDNSDCVDKLIINNHKSEMIYLSLHFLPAFFQLKHLFPFCLCMWNRHKRHPLHPAHGNEDSTKCPEREIRSSVKTAAPARIAFHCGHPTLPSSRSLWKRFGISWKTLFQCGSTHLSQSCQKQSLAQIEELTQVCCALQ